MPWSIERIKFLSKSPKRIISSDGAVIELYEFKDDEITTIEFSAWAKHFRNHYCLDDDIDILRKGTKLSKAEYLRELKFPTAHGFGPGISAGDFAEILVADFIEFQFKHWVPRTRYGNKTIRDESTKGTDLISIKLFDNKESSKDILTLFEVKAQFSGTKPKSRLQDAVKDSIKDESRKAESLNAIKQRLYEKGSNNYKIIERFQNPEDKPFKEQYGAAALFNSNLIDEKGISETDVSEHPSKNDVFLIVIHNLDFMNLVNKLYTIAADEA